MSDEPEQKDTLDLTISWAPTEGAVAYDIYAGGTQGYEFNPKRGFWARLFHRRPLSIQVPGQPATLIAHVDMRTGDTQFMSQSVLINPTIRQPE